MKQETFDEELKKLDECETCEDCVSWLKHCHAECCKVIWIKDNPAITMGNKYLEISCKLDMSLIWYYTLRGCTFVRNKLRFPLKNCILMEGYIWYVNPCKLLKNNFCEGHPDKKPKLCRDLTLETAGLPGCVVTPNCLFKYKKAALYKELIKHYTDKDIEVFYDMKARYEHEKGQDSAES